MKKISITEVEHDPERPARRRITDALGTTDMSICYYELEPGETFGGGYHTHHDQEEIFYIQSGEATFHTDEGNVLVGSGEFIRFGPSDFQSGFNDTEDLVTALGFGAPPNSTEVEVVRQCLECSETFTHVRPSILGDTGFTRQKAVPCPICEGTTRRVNRPDESFVP